MKEGCGKEGRKADQTRCYLFCLDGGVYQQSCFEALFVRDI